MDVEAADVQETSARYYLWIVALLAVAASLMGVKNGFAFDDVYVIVQNPRFHTLSDPLGLLTGTYWPAQMGSMLYRPSTNLVFAMQWVSGSGSPLPFHLVSIALYTVLSVAVYRLGALLVPARAAFIAAAIFAVHPVHVEAVANVVGQAELWVGLIVVLVVTSYLRLRRTGPIDATHIAVYSIGYLVACGFKEHAIMLPGLLIGAELFVVSGKSDLPSVRLRKMLPLLVVMAIAGIAFLAARYAVLHGVAIDSRAEIFKEQSFAVRFFTMMAVVLEWVRLLFWPMNLAADYSYPRIRPHTGVEISMLPAVAVIVGTVMIGAYMRKRSPAATFGVWWTGVALLIPSNLIIVTGFVLAERTLLLPTVGFVLCIGIAIHELLNAADEGPRLVRPLTYALLGSAIVVFTVRSATRSLVWKDNATLLPQTIVDAPSSHRAHWMLAMELKSQNRMAEALDEVDLAVTLGDQKDALLIAYAADMFAMAGRCPRALTLYRRALAIVPDKVQLRANTSFCLINIGKLEEAKAVALDPAGAPGDPALLRMAAVSDSLQIVRAARLRSADGSLPN